MPKILCLLLGGLVSLTLVGPAQAALDTNPANPLARPGPWLWSTIATKANPELLNYQRATDPREKVALAKIAKTPKARWFANCRSCNVDTIRREVARYVADSRRTDPDALVQLAIFGLWPDGEIVNGTRPALSWTLARYQAWIKEIAAGIGNARVAIILEPDLAISANHGDALKDPTPYKRMRFAAWSAQYLSQTLKREAIYLDVGSADWLRIPNAVRLLKASGIRYVRGFALGATHYDGVADNVRYAATLSAALGAEGITGKKAVIDTADNGTPFTWLQWRARWGDKYAETKNDFYRFDNTPTCRSRTERVCQTLGHRPTWNPLDAEAAKVGLGTDNPTGRRQAARVVDGFLWFGRGWRWMQTGGNDPYTYGRSVRMGTFTPFLQAG